MTYLEPVTHPKCSKDLPVSLNRQYQSQADTNLKASAGF